MAGKQAKLELLEPKLNDPELWNDPDTARRVTQEATQLRRVVEEFSAIAGDVQGLAELLELATSEEEAELADEVDHG